MHSTNTTAAGRRRADIRMVQNILLIWLDNNIVDDNQDCRNTVTKLRHVVNDITMFTDGDECIQFINTINDNKVCMIISGSLGQRIVPRVHNMFQVDSIFIFCENKKYHEQWTKEWSKIKGVFTEITLICEALKQASQQCEQNAISISFVSTNGDGSNKNLDRLDPMFMYTTIMKEILLTIKFDTQHFKEFIRFCRDEFAENEKELKNIDQFKLKYHDGTPIWWYTCDNFLYPMLNRTLRMSDVDIIIKMGFFISDLHRHIEELHKKQFGGHHAGKTYIVYRGQCVSKTTFEQMKKTKGGLMSFNNFLSTSKHRDVSLPFTYNALADPDSVGILFVMTIDPSKTRTPFASINGISYFPEEDEVLFAMHTVFRIRDIKYMGENQRLFQVDLTLTDENDDKDLRKLTDRIREESFPNAPGWYRLGLVLLTLGQFEKAQQVYQALLEQATNGSEKASIYAQIGTAKGNQGQYKEAITFYEKSLEIYKRMLPSNHPDLATSYNNIGSVYYHMGEYSKALSSHGKALEIRQQSLPSNHPDLALSYNNIGSLHGQIGQYAQALPYFEKAFEIRQQSLPSNHPDFAMAYNSIGSVYYHMGEYSKALSYYEKALEIQKQSLSSNHPYLALSYNNIGLVYDNMGDYSKALSSHRKALDICQQSLPPNHSNFGRSYCNIGEVYRKMGEYSEALSYGEKAFKIYQKSLAPNHPDLAMSYNNIGLVYDNMGDYSKALSSHEKALEIRQQSLPSKHPHLASSYNSIGMLYENMHQYSKALTFCERAVNIGQQSLPSNHPDLKDYRENLNRVKKKL